MWLLGPFLIFYVMIRYWQITLLVAALALAAWLFSTYPVVGVGVVGGSAMIAVMLLRWREQAADYRERERADH